MEESASVTKAEQKRTMERSGRRDGGRSIGDKGARCRCCWCCGEEKGVMIGWENFTMHFVPDNPGRRMITLYLDYPQRLHSSHRFFLKGFVGYLESHGRLSAVHRRFAAHVIWNSLRITPSEGSHRRTRWRASTWRASDGYARIENCTSLRRREAHASRRKGATTSDDL